MSYTLDAGHQIPALEGWNSCQRHFYARIMSRSAPLHVQVSSHLQDGIFVGRFARCASYLLAQPCQRSYNSLQEVTVGRNNDGRPKYWAVPAKLCPVPVLPGRLVEYHIRNPPLPANLSPPTALRITAISMTSDGNLCRV